MRSDPNLRDPRLPFDPLSVRLALDAEAVFAPRSQADVDRAAARRPLVDADVLAELAYAHPSADYAIGIRLAELSDLSDDPVPPVRRPPLAR